MLQRTGEIIASGVDGFLRFHPDSIIVSSFQPPLAIASLHKYVTDGKGSRILEVKGISALRHIELPFSENTLAFEFAAFNFRQAAQNQYAYKLEGLATEWTYIGNKREVTFSNLPRGSYTLRVKASNNDGVWNEEGISLKITIRPPWYRCRRDPNLPHPSSLIPDMEDVFLQKIKLLLEARFADVEFDVAQLCRVAGMSQPQLYRKLKALTGQTIVAWMRRFRLEKAKELLLSSELNVSEVAFWTGFNDPAYFSRAFSEEFGETPVGIKDRKNS